MNNTAVMTQPYMRRRRRSGICCAFLAALVLSALCLTWQAETDPDTGREKSALTDFAISMLDTILGTDADEDGSAASTVKEEVSITFNVSGTTLSSIDMLGFTFSDSVADMVNSVNKISRNVAMVLLIVMFCLSLMQGYIDGNQYDEIFIKKLVVFGISLAFLYYAQVICMELSNLGTEILSAISGEAASSAQENTLRDTIYEECTYEASGSTWSVENIGKSLTAFINSLKYIIVFALPWLMTWIATILIRVVCISRSLEMIVLVAFAPLAFVNIHGHSSMEGMIRFIRNYLSVCIQGAIIFIAALLCSQLSGTIVGELVLDGSSIGSTLSSLLNVALIYVVEAGFVSRSRQIAQTLVGN